MVSLPLFKFAALFVRHISKYGGNLIKAQAHDHPKFRAYAARYGQTMHQINMRMAVTLLKNTKMEKRAKEKSESSPTKIEEQNDQEVNKEKFTVKDTSSVWKRKFRPLPETKAVDLFADVLGDSFVLLVAGSLIFYEYLRSKGKPDIHAEKIAEVNKKLEELERRESDLENANKQAQNRINAIELALTSLEKDTSKKTRSKINHLSLS